MTKQLLYVILAAVVAGTIVGASPAAAQSCSELRRACEMRDELGERGQGNCRRYREACAQQSDSPAQAQSCQSLWIERNQIYKDGGYCFKTERAIDYFGNNGCYVGNENALRLSRSDRQRIDEIVRLERAKGCS